ncbi:MAG: ABC transporter substrate-binding protein [Erysipelotrichaceae bacterium]|nr:ABC transporter substrate-binding protein [Erysipelotrichaceae bacterium]
MKNLFKVSSLISLGILLSACGSKSTSEVAQVMDAKEKFGCNVLNVYNWGEYIGPNTIKDFEKAYNATVKYDLYESNEIMYTKLMGGSSYDILVPSDYTIERLIAEDMLQPIDKSVITNLDVLTDGVKNLPFDPDNTYSVPYFWGSVGILYNKNNVDPAIVEEKGFNILLDEIYKGKVFMYDSERDSFMVAFKALGYSMNTESPEEIQKAYEWLTNSKKAVDPAYVTDEVIDAMANGEKDIAIMYSGDAAYVISENSDMAYHAPKSGTNIWSDSMVIPKNASCPALANEFINFVLGYDQAYSISETVGYASVNDEVLKALSGKGGYYESNDAYLPRSGYEKDEVFKYNETLKKELSDLWIRVKNQ